MEECSAEKQESLYEEADRLKKEYPNLDDLVVAIGIFIHQHSRSIPNRKQPKNIIESRFTPTAEAFEKGMISCGVLSNISAEMLRHVGYKVMLVHGECEKSVDHAWISVLNPETNTWKEYDLSREDGNILDTHVKKQEVFSWDDIKDQIIDDHKTLGVRQRRKGIK